MQLYCIQLTHPASPPPRSYRRPMETALAALTRSVSPGRYGKAPLALTGAGSPRPSSLALSLTRGSLDAELAAAAVRTAASPLRTSLRTTTLAPRYTPPPASPLESDKASDYSLGNMPEVRALGPCAWVQ